MTDWAWRSLSAASPCSGEPHVLRAQSLVAAAGIEDDRLAVAQLLEDRAVPDSALLPPDPPARFSYVVVRLTFAARGPFGLSATSNSTPSPSRRSAMPSPSKAVAHYLVQVAYTCPC